MHSRISIRMAISRTLCIGLVAAILAGAAFMSQPAKSVQADLITTSVVLDTTNPTYYGTQVTFYANITPLAATGYMIFTEGGINIAGCEQVPIVHGETSARAACTILPSIGNHEDIRATYSGDLVYESTTSDPISHLVRQVELTVTANNKSRAYGEENPAFDATITGFVNDEDLESSDVTGSPTCTSTATSASGVAGSPYSITCTQGSLASFNYRFTMVDGELTVNQAITGTTLSPVDGSSEYGSSSVLTATVSPSTAVGTVTFSDDGVEIPGCIARPLTGGEATCSLSALSVGHYTNIRADYSGNADFTASASATVDHDVTQAELTVTANDRSRAYGTDNPSFDATISGFVNGEDLGSSDVTGSPVCTTAATSASGVAGSPYAITCALGSLSSSNYSFSMANGNLTITQVELTVTAKNKSRVYGGSDPAFDATISGFVNGENLGSSDVTGSPACTTTATATSGVAGSPYPITCAPGSLASANYSFSLVGGNLTITPAGLTVKANDKSRAYKEENPALDATISGFANGENLGTSDVTGSPVCTTTATSDSEVAGSPYPITCALGNLASTNYSFNLVDGSLTITRASTQTSLLPAGGQSEFGEILVFIAQVSPLEAAGTVTFLDDGVNIAGCVNLPLVDGEATCSVGSLGVGHHTNIQAAYDGNSNYATSFSDAVIHVVMGKLFIPVVIR